MSRHYSEIAFTPAVRRAQSHYGSRRAMARQEARERQDPNMDALSDEEREFIAERDSFYMATVSESGWPYVQHRGGPIGFLKVLDEHTLAWADFRGDREYVSTGNLAGDGRVCLMLMDYPNRFRLKILGRARITDTADAPELVDALADPSYKAIVERAVQVSVDAWDWNCTSHITPRFTTAELNSEVAPLRHELHSARAEISELRASHQ